MVTTDRILDTILRVKGNLIKMNFMVDRRSFETFVPDDQLFRAIKDILLNREYEYLPEFELLNFKGKRVVDVGAHVGLYSLVASVFAKEVISVEPHPLNFRILEINKTINETKNIITLNKALWSKRVTLKIYEGVHSGEHLILQNSPNSNKHYLVQSITLEELINGFGKIDLLKMDIEGSEFEIFKNLDTDIIGKIDNLCIEIHTLRGEVSQIAELLIKNEFKIRIFHPPLTKRDARYEIELKNFYGLKALRKVIYSLFSLSGRKDESLMILFGNRVK